MRLLFLLSLLCISITIASAQVSITTTGTPPDPSSMLDIKNSTKGVLIPRMTFTQRNLISLPANALLIYQTDNNPGFYYNQGTPLAPVWLSLFSFLDIDNLRDRIPIDSLPYTISAPGSYYATANLSGTVGITITTSHVTLDLNGYTLKGTVGNTSEGIKVTAAVTNINIKNGGVANWGKEGIKAGLATNSSFSQLQIVANSFDGINTGNNDLISFVDAGTNGFDGIDMGESAAIFHCTASGNGNDGIEADAGSSFMQCTARGNTQEGFRATGASTISDCASSENLGDGYSCGAGSIVEQCTALHNSLSGFYLFSTSSASDNTSRNNGHHGFEFLNDCILQSNNASLNSFSGFSTTFNGGKLDNNNSSTNTQHGFNIQNTGGCLIIRNTASGNGISAFNIVPGNTFATAVTSATINTNTNPFANFQL
ncbi:MAG: right-handed parallel beta-helix repeat-containing protein [Saprospiraceae bacterium]|uniref:Right-handed parallel beta-helix repeat-containing protein n=1 Tax=Candidatus Opimibacter skivensis TaxID=2982028 RepID=A0A9D7SW00_9BACT|nr:right-handed parallel beta-helix repeat-containing protein [Candidatus Opimibacter skivensis]